MMPAGWAMAAVLATLGALMGSLKLVERRFDPPAELTRKLLHVGMGLVVLTFPWLFDRAWPVLLLSAMATAALVVMRLVPRLREGVGSVVNRVGRTSLGEIYFALSVGLVYWLSQGDPLLYCVPMLIMTLADATAALIGLAYGKMRFVTAEGLKSAEGSIAFFAIAFLSVHVPLLLYTDTGRAETLLIAVIIGILAMLLEAIAWRGLDNLLIPLGAFAFLKLYLHEPAEALSPRLIATLVLLAFALSWRRRSSLDDSALMAAALFGYGVLMLGGPRWLIGPVLLLIAHVVLWPRDGQRREHSIFAVLAVIATALLWLTLHVREPSRLHLSGYAVTFGVHLAIFGIAPAARAAAGSYRGRRLLFWLLAGWVLVLAQLISWPAAPRTGPFTLPIAAGGGLAGVAAGALAYFLARRRIHRSGQPIPIAFTYTLSFFAGLSGSLAAVGLEALVRGLV